jgi:threonine-phosphate decarboxylase
MAGLRLGYMMTNSVPAMEAAREYAQPWSVSAPAQAAGISALNLTGRMDETRKLITRERQFLKDSLLNLGIKVYPSDANFLLFKTEAPLRDKLIEKGILVRSCANYEGLDEKFTRICVSGREENERLIAAIKEVLNG